MYKVIEPSEPGGRWVVEKELGSYQCYNSDGGDLGIGTGLSVVSFMTGEAAINYASLKDQLDKAYKSLSIANSALQDLASPAGAKANWKKIKKMRKKPAPNWGECEE